MEISEKKSSQCLKEKKLVCLVCGKKYSNKLSYKRHRIKHLENHRSYECPVCDKTFVEKFSVKRHINLTHLGVKNFECAHCGGKYATKDNLVKHIRILHLIKPEQKQRAMKCLLCECYFRNKIHLSAHIRKQHRNQGSQENNAKEKQEIIKNKNANQPHADYLLATSSEHTDVIVRKEPEIHTSEIVMKNGRPHYKCDVCGIIQNKFSSLKRHMTTHEIIKKFKCPSCDIHYKYLSELRAHMKTSHVIKCRSNNNKMLWNSIKDLKDDIFVKIDKTKARNHKKTEINKKNLPQSKYYNNAIKEIQYPENYVHENTNPDEITNKLSMPILDDESVTSIPAAKQTEQINDAYLMSVEVPSLQNNGSNRNTNDIKSENEKNERSSSKYVKLLPSKLNELHKTIIVTEKYPTNTTKDALLGQANVPLIEKVTINIPEQNVKTITNSIMHDQVDTAATNDSIIIYPRSDGDLYSECEYFDKNILNIMGLNDIDSESSESFESSRIRNTELSMAVITDPSNIAHKNESVNGKLEQININKNTLKNTNYCKLNASKTLKITKTIDNNFEEYFHKHIKESKYVNEQIKNVTPMKVNNMNTNAVDSKEILYDQNSFEIAQKTHIKEVEGLKNYNIPRSNNTEKPDYITKVQSGSTLSSTSNFNADIDLHGCNIDVSFDLNELSMESNNANISLTDIVEGMYSQNDGDQKTVSSTVNFLETQTPEEIKITYDLRNLKNDSTAEIISPSDFLVDPIIQTFNTLNYDAEITNDIKINNRICTTLTKMQHQLQDMPSIDIEKYFQKKTNEPPEIDSATILSLYNPETNTAEKSVLSVNEDEIEKPLHNYSSYIDVERPTDLFYGNSTRENNSNMKFVSHKENKDEIYEDVDKVSFSPIKEMRTPNTVNNLGINEGFTDFNIAEQSELDLPDTSVRRTLDICENVNLIDKNKTNENSTLNDVEFLKGTSHIENITEVGVEKNMLQNHSTILYDIGQTDDNFGMNESDFKLVFNPNVIESNNQCEITENMQPTLQGNINISPELSTIRIAESTKESSISNCASDADAFHKILKNLKSMSSKLEHKCNECPASFQRIRDLRRHEIIHNPTLKYLCEVCGKCCPSKTSYNVHLKHHDSKKMICWNCERMRFPQEAFESGKYDSLLYTDINQNMETLVQSLLHFIKIFN